ncbi:hypothetical protein AB0B25_19050 [Nocardia sp. NPDC049190]|uniref:hypothetical protein n=1 Tax=Nocardia sp. NPDC049190 TaxID=3155650 RepID=UPI0033C41AD2
MSEERGWLSGAELVYTIADTEKVTDAVSGRVEQSDTESDTWDSVSSFRVRQMLPPARSSHTGQGGACFSTRH